MRSEDPGGERRAPPRDRPLLRVARACAMILARSFFPVAMLVVVLGTAIWGPWISLALAVVLWLGVDSLETAL